MKIYKTIIEETISRLADIAEETRFQSEIREVHHESMLGESVGYRRTIDIFNNILEDKKKREASLRARISKALKSLHTHEGLIPTKPESNDTNEYLKHFRERRESYDESSITLFEYFPRFSSDRTIEPEENRLTGDFLGERGLVGSLKSVVAIDEVNLVEEYPDFIPEYDDLLCLNIYDCTKIIKNIEKADSVNENLEQLCKKIELLLSKQKIVFVSVYLSSPIRLVFQMYFDLLFNLKDSMLDFLKLNYKILVKKNIEYNEKRRYIHFKEIIRV